MMRTYQNALQHKDMASYPRRFYRLSPLASLALLLILGLVSCQTPSPTSTNTNGIPQPGNVEEAIASPPPPLF